VTTLTDTDVEWTAPGRGQWERDTAHQATPFCGYLADFFVDHFNPGFMRAFARYGVLLDHFEVAAVRGWMYFRPRPVGAPDKPGRGLPPKPVFKALFAIHPGLRARRKAAGAAVDARRWYEDAVRWDHEGRDGFRRRLLALQAVDPTSLDDVSLAIHLAQVHDVLADGFRQHFASAVAHYIGVGDWAIKACEWTGATPAEAIAVLRGSSPASIATVAPLDRVADAVRHAAGARAILAEQGDPTDRLGRLRASSPAVDAALTAYLDEYGWRIATGFDLADRTTTELPHAVLASIHARLTTGSPTMTATGGDALRPRVPAQHQAEYDELLSVATTLYGLRDDDVGLCYQWPMGLLRRALLAAGSRLAARGVIDDAVHVIDATRLEVDALLGAASGPAPSGGELAARADDRRRVAAQPGPPVRLGDDEGGPPPSSWLPPAVARVNGALLFAMGLDANALAAPAANPSAAATAADPIHGHPASAGTYRGRARLVLGPADFEKLAKGDVLVAQLTSPTYNVVLPLLGAVVTDHGGVLSHPAIVAREFGIPAVVGTGEATARIPDGAIVLVDGDRGTVTLVD
jgi:phosphohistidine swiveling domain-containing protein